MSKEKEKKIIKTQIPNSFLNNLYDYTGAIDGSCKGFFLFSIDHSGEPSVTAKFDNTAIQMALQKSIEHIIEGGFDFEEDFDFDI